MAGAAAANPSISVRTAFVKCLYLSLTTSFVSCGETTGGRSTMLCRIRDLKVVREW